MSLFGSIMGYIDTGRAAKSISDANIAAEHGVLGAVQSGQAGVSGAVNSANDLLTKAGDQSRTDVNTAVGGANKTLTDTLAGVQDNSNPYIAAGKQGVQGLQDYAASKPQFNFNPDDYFNSPAYQFQLKQGQDAIQNRASAMGIGSGGGVLKDLTTFGQGLASTYYGDAFNRAKSTFDTNQKTTLDNLGALIDSGKFGTTQSNNAQLSVGGQQGQNTMTGGLFNAGSNLTIADLLSKMGLDAAKFNSTTGLTGSKLAGDYAVDAGQAHAGGILGQGKALTAGVADIGNLIKQFMGGG